MKKIGVNIRVFILLLLAILLSLYLGWMVNAQLGYGYSWLYDAYEIDQHIEQYAPQNNYRFGFEQTSRKQHIAIFQQIVDSVHGSVGATGKSLAAIEYSANGRRVPVLHKAEILHLQDVAVLIKRIHMLAAASFFLFILFFHWHFHTSVNDKKRAKRAADGSGTEPAASVLGVSMVFIALVIAIAVVFYTVGATEIFYQLHVWIFPDNHQWFFYYQDSLMSTLMKAPDLFAGIAIQILLVAVAIFLLGSWMFYNSRFKNKRLSAVN